MDHLKGLVHEMGLKSKVRVNKAGCLDACSKGPTLVIYPDETWYAPRTKEDMEEILIKHVQNNRPVERLQICLLYTSPSPRDGLLSRMPSSA